MKVRHDTWEGDLAKLWEVLPNAKVPAGMLMAKIKEMKSGEFMGKMRADQITDEELYNVIKKYKLDDDATAKLNEFLHRRPDTRKNDLSEIELRLRTSSKPSALVM